MDDREAYFGWDAETRHAGSKRTRKIVIALAFFLVFLAGLGMGLTVYYFAFCSSPPAAIPLGIDLTAAVATKFGFVVGNRLQQTTEFLGVPYAKPPVGRMRWTRPQLWDAPFANGVLFATKFSPACYQP